MRQMLHIHSVRRRYISRGFALQRSADGTNRTCSVQHTCIIICNICNNFEKVGFLEEVALILDESPMNVEKQVHELNETLQEFNRKYNERIISKAHGIGKTFSCRNCGNSEHEFFVDDTK